MNPRWLWLDHVPPGVTLSDEERREVRRLAMRMRKTRPSAAKRSPFMMAIGTPFIIMALSVLLFGVLSILGIGSYVFGSLIVFVLCIAGTFYVRHRMLSPHIRRALCERGHPVCIECGYVLAGLDGEEAKLCPECGTPPVFACPDCGRLLDDIKSNVLTCPGCAAPIRAHAQRWLEGLGLRVCEDCGHWLGDDPAAANCPNCGSERSAS